MTRSVNTISRRNTRERGTGDAIDAFIREDSLAKKTLVDAASSANNTTRAVNIRRKETRQKIKSTTEMYHGMSKNIVVYQEIIGVYQEHGRYPLEIEYFLHLNYILM